MYLPGNYQDFIRISDQITNLISRSVRRQRGSEIDFILLIGRHVNNLVRLLDENGVFGDKTIVSLVPSYEVYSK